jgi:glucan phosphoethanolaminetransferase (alkaline phosphatase superfamily)
LFDLVKKTPWQPMVWLLAAQTAAMLPFFFAGKLRPLFFVYLGEISWVDLAPTLCFAVGHAAALVAALSIGQWSFGKWGLRVLTTVIVVHFLAMVVAVLYYGNFGQYPRLTLLQDLLITPVAVIGYGISGGSGSDFFLGLVAAATAVSLTIYTAWRIQQTASLGDVSFLATALAIGCLTVGTSLVGARGAFGALRVSQFHGIPAALVWGTIADSLQQSPLNQPTCATANLPVRLVATGPSAELERPAHIVLIVMESFRADHVPLYGYGRNTMPRLQETRDDWLVFSNYRSAAPMTAASLRAMLSSRYLQLGSNENTINDCVAGFWNSLSAVGYRTAFLTGADLRWHYLDQVTKANACDEYFHFHAVDEPTRRASMLTDRSDSSLNDSLVIERAGHVLQRADQQQSPTFSLLYLLNLHQPYHSDPEDRHFNDASLPSVVADQRILDMKLSEGHRVALHNQYDNSIVNFDKNLSNLLTRMRHGGLLEKSVVIVTGDHGEAFGEHGTYYHGTTVYDEQIKVPLMIRVGSELPKLRQALAKNRRAVATGVDLSPTILSIAGGKIPAEFQGASLTDVDRKRYDMVFWTAGYQMAAVFTERHKYIYDMETRRAEGYDLSADPQERNNLLEGDFENFASFLNYLQQLQVIDRTSQER